MRIKIKLIIVKIKQCLGILKVLFLLLRDLLLLLHRVLRVDLLMILFVEPLVGACVLDTQETVLNHDEEDVLHNTKQTKMDKAVVKRLHNSAEGKDHDVGHAE